MKVDNIEKILIEQCLRNDPISQKKLYDKYCDAMYTIAYRITNNEEIAQEALQDAFIQIFRKLNTYRGEATLAAWIKKIVSREAIRKSKKEIFFEEITDYNTDPIEWQDGLNGEYLHNAITQLPDGYRKVFVLIEVEGYSHKEVAEMLRIAEGTSKSQLFYAKKMLQKKLDELIK